jgi:hypothetical protein
MTEEDEAASLEGAAVAVCPYCGEEVELTVDPVGAASEQYVEDCPVCCRPWTVSVTRDDASVEVSLSRDDD